MLAARTAAVAVGVGRRAAGAAAARLMSSRTESLIDPSLLQVELTQQSRLAEMPPNDKLGFGTTFSDHMLSVDWTEEGGWAAPRIHPYGPMAMDPAASCLHYALECFEGLKAYIGDDDEIRLFRPEMNMARMNRSLDRLYMPTFNGDAFLELIRELLRIDKAWIPRGDGVSMYIRPTGISTFPFLGVGPTKRARIYTILSPVGSYYGGSGIKPVTLYADTTNVRAWPGGTGGDKVGGNYAPTIKPQVEAMQKHGADQIMWLYGPDKEITEVGAMNLFFVLENKDNGDLEVVTAPLQRGDILPGVTRDSVIQLVRSYGIGVTERYMTLNELEEAASENRLKEVLGSGTAAVISSVNTIVTDTGRITVGDGIGSLTQRLYDNITGIQYGRIPHEWSQVVDESASLQAAA